MEDQLAKYRARKKLECEKQKLKQMAFKCKLEFLVIHLYQINLLLQLTCQELDGRTGLLNK